MQASKKQVLRLLKTARGQIEGIMNMVEEDRSSTIESGTRVGLIISSFASALILLIDFIYVPNNSINSYFESDIVLACAFVIIAWTIGFYVRSE